MVTAQIVGNDCRTYFLEVPTKTMMTLPEYPYLSVDYQLIRSTLLKYTEHTLKYYYVFGITHNKYKCDYGTDC